MTTQHFFKYYWLRFKSTGVWVIFEAEGKRYYGMGNYWSPDSFDKIIGPLAPPETEVTNPDMDQQIDWVELAKPWHEYLRGKKYAN